MTTSYQLDEKDIETAILEWMERNGKIHDGEKGTAMLSHGPLDRGQGHYYTATVMIRKAQ